MSFRFPRIRMQWFRFRWKHLVILGVALLVAGSVNWKQDSLQSYSNLNKVLDQKDKETVSFVVTGNNKDTSIRHSLPNDYQGEPYYYTHSNDSLDDFPWIQEYGQWHNKIRQQFPDTQLMDHPDAPPLLIVFYKLGNGGLTGRFSKLGKILHTCYEEKRVLLLKWYHPMELENFLVPNLFNWTVPNHPNASTSDRLIASYKSYEDDLPSRKIAIDRGGKLIPMEKKFKENFGVYWYAYFRPSVLVQSAMEESYTELGLVPGHYNAIHCRIRHPAHDGGTRMNTADHGGLLFEGEAKYKAIKTAIHAIKCSNWLTNQTSEPNYFYSDSEDLVEAVIRHEQSEDEIERTLHTLANQSRVVGRHVEHPIAHIGFPNQTVDSYVSTFVDLYIAANARCISLGVGRFAHFAARLSGTQCLVIHEMKSKRVAKAWDMVDIVENVPECPVPTEEAAPVPTR